MSMAPLAAIDELSLFDIEPVQSQVPAVMAFPSFGPMVPAPGGGEISAMDTSGSGDESIDLGLPRRR